MPHAWLYDLGSATLAAPDEPPPPPPAPAAGPLLDPAALLALLGRRPVVAPGPPEAATLLAAVRLHWDATPSLAGFADGLRVDRARARPSVPYAVVEEGPGPVVRTSSTSVIRDQSLAFRVHAATLEEAERLRDLVADAFDAASLPFLQGHCLLADERGRTSGEARSRAPGGGPLWWAEVAFSARVRRPRRSR